MARYGPHKTFDKSLLYNLNIFQDFKVFGTIKFNKQIHRKTMRYVFLKLQRPSEIKHKGQWFVRYEGYNQGTHNLHFLLGNGYKESNTEDLILNLNENFKTFAAAERASGVFTKFEPDRGHAWYLSKQIESDQILNPIAEDRDQGNNWEMSPALMKAIQSEEDPFKVIHFTEFNDTPFNQSCYPDPDADSEGVLF